MNLLEVKSLEELKTLGKHRELVAQFKEIVGEKIKFITKSWQNLYDSISNYNDSLHGNECPEIKQDKDQYFVSKEAEIIFYLVDLSGEIRLTKLGLTKNHYSNKNKATKWRNTILKIIHPDKCLHLNSSEATKTLNSIYKEMIGNKK